MGRAGPTVVDGNPKKVVGVYIVGRLVRARLGRLVRSDWTN
jgi:hypothetical protein